MLEIKENRFTIENIYKLYHFRDQTRHFRGSGSGLFSSERSMTTVNDVMKRHHQNDVSKAKFRNCDRVLWLATSDLHTFRL